MFEHYDDVQDHSQKQESYFILLLQYGDNAVKEGQGGTGQTRQETHGLVSVTPANLHQVGNECMHVLYVVYMDTDTEAVHDYMSMQQ